MYVDIKELLHYNPDTGEIRWKSDGTLAGNKLASGYIIITLPDKTLEYAHRLAFKLMGEEVPELVDHINGIKDDNRWVNLRSSNKVDNACNAKLRDDNKTGYKGISWDSSRQRWRVSVTYNKKTISKRFKHFDDAVECMEKLRKELHSEYCRFK